MPRPLAFVCLLFVCAAAQRLDLPEHAACGKDGVCTQFDKCSWARIELRNGRRPEVCSFVGNNPIVCCPIRAPTETSSVSTRTEDPPLSFDKDSIAAAKCREYSEAIFGRRGKRQELESDRALKTHECAIGEPPYPLTFVVAGTDAQPMEFPHMVQLGYGRIKATASYECGGSLISEEWVLTAAHCIKTTFGRPTWVRAGDLDISSNTDNAKPIIVAVERVVTHPSYDQSSLRNDVALVRLACSLTLTPYIRPACLPTTTSLGVPQVSGRIVVVAAGWGLTEFGGLASKVLQKVRLAIVDKDVCNKTYQNRIQDNIMICAEGTDKKKMGDTCQGDSGGPLHSVLTDPYCMYNIVGVTSFGIQCGVAPGVYTRIATFTKWIEQIVWKTKYNKLKTCNTQTVSANQFFAV